MKNPSLTARSCLGIILLLGFLARFSGIHFGLPHPDARPDETTLIQIALGFFQGDWNPHFFNYPSFFLYTLFLIYGLYFRLRAFTGATPEDILFEMTFDPSFLYLIARVLSATAGVLTIALVWRIASRLENQRLSWVSAFYLSLCYLHVRDSHFGTTDVLMTFWSYCALYHFLEYQQKPSLRSLFWSGFFSGIAISTKYGAVVLLPSMLALLVFQQGRAQRAKIKDFALYGVLTISFFFAGTPYALLDWSQFSSDFLDEMQHLSEGHHQIILGQGWWYHGRYSLPYGMTWPLFLLALIGLGIHLKISFRKAFFFYLFPCCVYLSAGKGYTVFVRYMIPLLPAFCISAGVATIAIVDRFRVPRLLPLLALCCILPSAYQIFHLNRLLLEIDNRLICASWIEENIPSEKTIYQPDFFIAQTHQFSRSAFTQQYVNVNRHAQVRLSPNYPRWTEDMLSKKILPEYILLQQSPIRQSNSLSEWVNLVLKKHYQHVQSFEGVDLQNKQLWYDQQDAFYLPLVGLSQVIRPGPNFYLYQKR